MSTEDATTIYDLSTSHCARCDSEGRRMIKFRSPNNRTTYLCARCVEQEDKREMRFTPGWKRSRRPSRRIEQIVSGKSLVSA